MICDNCQSKIKKNWTYCPFCGFSLRNVEREKSFLDREEPFESFGNISFKDLVKQIDQQLRGIDKAFKFGAPSRGISISINSVGSKPKISVKRFGDFKEKKIKEFKEKPKIFSFRKKPKKIEEPKSTVRRLSDKLVYEIDVPGVSSVKNISINRLENSIEVKAFGKDKAYFKLIPVNMDVSNYYLKDGKLIVELKEEVNNMFN